MQRLAGVAAAIVVLMVGACASPQSVRPEVNAGAVAEEQQRQSLFVLESRAADYERVYDIAERLSRANTDLCARTAPEIGIRVENINDYPRDFRESARSLWGLSDVPTVQWLGEGGPAEQAGVRVRDQILGVNGRAITGGRRASRQVLNLVRDAAAEGDVTLQLKRGVESMTLIVSPKENCAYHFVMLDQDAVNAAADGFTIMLNRGMLRFVESDEELALVLGHELAHNAMGHVDSMRQNAAMGAVGGAVLDILAAAAGVNTGGAFSDAGGDIGRMMFSRDFESEADYVGMYFLARANYQIAGVEHFWRRMAAESPSGIRLAYTHPNTAERFLRISSTQDEIAQKLANGATLRPNMRGESGLEPTAAPSPAAPAPPTDVGQSDPPAPAPANDAISVAPSTPQ